MFTRPGIVPWLENLERSEVWTKEGGGSNRLKSPLIGIEHEEIPLSPMNMSIFHNHEDVHYISLYPMNLASNPIQSHSCSHFSTFFSVERQLFVFQEVKVLSTMDHPHIIRALDLGTWEEIRPLKTSGGDFIWLVVTGTMDIYKFHFIYIYIYTYLYILMGCHHPSHWLINSIIFQDGHIAPPTSHQWMNEWTNLGEMLGQVKPLALWDDPLGPRRAGWIPPLFSDG